MFQLLIVIGPLALLAGLIAAVAIYVMKPGTASGGRVTFTRYVAVTLGAGIAAFCAGSALGIGIACFAVNAGNLCGLVGIFGLGPLLAGVAMIAAAIWLLRQN